MPFQARGIAAAQSAARLRFGGKDLDITYFVGALGGAPSEKLLVHDVREISTDIKKQVFTRFAGIDG